MPTPIISRLLSKPPIIMPKDVNGNVLSLIAKQGNNGQIPVAGTKIWSDRSKARTQYSYSNLVANGDFSNATTGYIYGIGSTVLVNNNELSFLADSQYDYIQPSQTLVMGKKYYFCAKVKTTSASIRVLCTDNTTFTTGLKNHTGSNTYELMSGVITIPTGAVNAKFQIRDERVSGFNTFYVKEVMAIDLTALGLETLSAEQCDALFNFTAVTNTATTPITQVKYNPLDWAQWNIPAVGVTRDNTGLELTADSSIARYSYILSSFKPSTKYGLLYNVVNSNINGNLSIDLNYWVFDANGNLGKTVGNQKFVATSKSSITGNNALYVAVSTNNTAGLKIKLKDIRVFELPVGSQIESDFTNLTADQLNTLYPMGVNEVVTARANDCLMVNQAGNSTSGFNSEVNSVTGKTVYFNKLDGTDDYGAFANTPSLDITTNEFALACTFKAPPSGTQAGYIIQKNNDAFANIQYGIQYSGNNLILKLNGLDISTLSLVENIWYNVIYYRNSDGRVKPYFNKIEKANQIYATALVSQPNIRIGVRSANAGGTSHTGFFKGDIATISIYQAPTLNINRIMKAEMTISCDYTGVK